MNKVMAWARDGQVGSASLINKNERLRDLEGGRSEGGSSGSHGRG